MTTWFVVYRRKNGRYGWLCHRCGTVGTERWEADAWQKQYDHLCTHPESEAA